MRTNSFKVGIRGNGMDGLTQDLVSTYASLFVHCWDYYVIQCLHHRGYWSYRRPAYDRLSLSRLADHLQGRYTLGAYVLDRQGFCSFAVFDDDREDGLVWLVLLAE